MSRFWETDADLFVPHHDEHEEAMPGRDSDGVICKDCGKGGLRWQQDDKGWWLEGADGYQHECDQDDRDAVVRGMFDDLTC